MKAPLSVALAMGFVVALLPVQAADEPPADKEQPLQEISLEIQALRSFTSLNLTDDQLGLLAKLAKETGEPRRKRTEPKASPEYVQLFKDLRAALASQDDDKAGELDEEIGQLGEKESPEVDDGFGVTTAARKRAPELIKTFKPSQLAAYYGSLGEDALDPLLYLKDSLTEVRGLEKDDWRARRDEIADQVAWLTVGADPAQWEKVSDRTMSLLCKARALSAEEFKAQEADLKRAAKEIVGEVGPDVVLRHYAERTLSELLSNPCLEAAVKTRLK